MATREKKLRSGFTTGACAAAAAKAAALLLFCGRKMNSVEIPFPGGLRHDFSLKRLDLVSNTATASIIKDAGDDPDVTNGAEIIAMVTTRNQKPEGEKITLQAGDGVGMVTKPGLQVAVGEPAINPVPRQMIREAITEAMETTGLNKKITVTISVTDGEKLAAKTLNHRLGIIGGLSILGTTGIVRPVSAEAWTATIQASMQVARAAGLTEVVLSTGRTSERAIQKLSSLPEEAFAMMGDYLEFSLRQAKKQGFEKIHLAAMWGKICKAALEIPQTHVRHGALEPDHIVNFLQKTVIDKETANRLQGANTAREIHQRLIALNRPDIITQVCRQAKQYAEKISGLPVTLYLINSQKEVEERV